jgi:histidine ammonia-lyase
MTSTVADAPSHHATDTILLDGHSLAIEDLVALARDRRPLQLHPDAIKRIEKCRALLERKIAAREIMYGVNTGIGELSEVVLTPEQVEKFQKYLLYSHAAGCGEPCAEEDVRAGMISRLNTHCWGHSGIRNEIVQTQIAMLNKGVTPVVCQKGSVGACGDLSPMSQMALTLMGEGEVFYQGRRLPAKQGMQEAGIPTITFRERDGLATINGSDLTTGIGCRAVRRHPLAEDAGDRAGHDAGGAERQHDGLRPAHSRDPRLSRSAGMRREHPPSDR